MLRKFPRPIKRVVVKIGSSLIATHRLKPSMARLRSIVEQVSRLRKKNIDVTIVSSGAIVLGLGELKKINRLVGLESLQAAAAIGQTKLMSVYSALFDKQKQKCAQVLLTWDDFDNRTRYNNARKTLNALFDNKIIPIINENDTVSTNEIRRGDNDKLSALVSSSVQADLLILLSDVDGLYLDSKSDKTVLSEVKKITQEIETIAKGPSKKVFGKGGMLSKIEAVRIASQAKIPCVIANGRKINVIDRILSGERIGTLFIENDEKMLDRKHWISFSASPKGVLTIDDGAKKAILKGGKSLLLVGVTKWEGHFRKGDVVVIRDLKGSEVARGISSLADNVIAGFAERKGVEIIHVDNLILGEK